MSDDKLSKERLNAMLGDVAKSIGGGTDVDINQIDGPPPVTDETEEAYKAAQKKKAEEAANNGSESGGNYG